VVAASREVPDLVVESAEGVAVVLDVWVVGWGAFSSPRLAIFCQSY